MTRQNWVVRTVRNVLFVTTAMIWVSGGELGGVLFCEGVINIGTYVVWVVRERFVYTLLSISRYALYKHKNRSHSIYLRVGWRCNKS